MNTPRARRQKRPKSAGVSSPEHTPQVVVRAGKHYVCSGCGTLVEIPADVVGQFVFATNPTPSEEADTLPESERNADSLQVATESSATEDSAVEDSSNENSVVETPAVEGSTVKNSAAENCNVENSNAKNSAVASPNTEPSALSVSEQPPQRPQAAKPRRRANFHGQTIDGLRVPSGKQLDRAFKWVSFDLTILDQKHTEVDRLRKLLKKRRRQQPAASATFHCHSNRPVSRGKRRVHGTAGGARPTKTNHRDRLPPDAGPQPTAGQAPVEIPLSMAGESVAYESANADSYATDSVTSPTTNRKPGGPKLTLSQPPMPRGREPP